MALGRQRLRQASECLDDFGVVRVALF